MRSQDADTSYEQSQPLQWHYTVLDDRNFEIRGKTLFFIVVVFSVLLVLTLLFLYVRWSCRYRHAAAASSSSSSSSAQAAPAPPRGLDAAAIKGLPVVMHGAAGEAAECCICLGAFEDGERVKVLPRCCHCYHPECVDRWLSAQPSCPLCRNSLRVDPAGPMIVIVE